MPYVPVPSYSDNDYLKKSKEFRALMTQAQTLRTQIDDLEKQLAEIKDGLEAELLAAEVESVTYHGWRVTVVDVPSKQSVDKKMLLKVLVDSLGQQKAKLLAKKAMKATAAKHYVQLSSPKENEESANE